MQALQHKRFTTMPSGRQVRNELSSSAIRYWYMPLGAGNRISNDKRRPWFERLEA